jgi:hypothetical protein
MTWRKTIFIFWCIVPGFAGHFNYYALQVNVRRFDQGATLKHNGKVKMAHSQTCKIQDIGLSSRDHFMRSLKGSFK